MTTPSAQGAEPIPISLVAHQAFCPRRAWLEAMGEHTDTAQMATGTRQHRGTDDRTGDRANRRHGVEVLHPGLGIVGRCDTVEVADDGSLTVVEYKATPVRRRAEVTRAMRIQLALQVMALREMGFQVSGQAIYFTQHQVRVPVELTDDDLSSATDTAQATATTIRSATAPPALEDDPRCGRCSHVGVCLPDERPMSTITRRIRVADPDSQVLHLATPGSRASIRRGRIEVNRRGERLHSIPVERVQAVVVHGNVDVSGALIRDLLWRGLTIVWGTSNGRMVGWASSARSPNGGPRHRQHQAAAIGQLDLAREFIASKIANQATLLRRHGGDTTIVDELRSLQRRVPAAHSLTEIYGIEGDAAARYFAQFSTMLTAEVRAGEGLSFTTRTRRPARDPVNAALNYSYGMLLADLVRAVVCCGLDPHAGFLHSSERNKPALALDLCEEFRAPVADSVVIGAFNNGELKARDFTTVLGTTNLRDPGRKALIAAYERRVTGTFQHPVFGYTVSWRRAMEVQARLVLGVVDGTQPYYKGIRIR